jgi:hypothetical protein
MINTLKSAPLGEERFEVKFAGASSARDVMDAWVRTHRAGFIKPYPSRRVNSTYFDTHSLSAYEENLIGASLREKVRLRWYGEHEITENATLEVKLRRNKLGWKLSYPVSGAPQSGESWREVQSRVRQQLPADARVRFDAHPMAVLTNRYHRQYFLSGDGLVRLTIDTNLRAYDQRFGRGPNVARSLELPDMLVVEFKFSPRDRRAAMEMIRGIPLRVSRSSKYSIACAAIAVI